MIVKPLFDSKYQLVTNIKYYNELVVNKEYSKLSAIFSVDENEAKNLSSFDIIDGPESEKEKTRIYNRFMKSLDNSMGYDFMGRNQLAFAQDKSLVIYDFGKISSLIDENKIDEKTPWCNTFLKINEDDLFLPFGYSPFAFSFFSE